MSPPMLNRSSIYLCYGARVDAKEWAMRIGIKFGESKMGKCNLCGYQHKAGANFCSNCGAEARMAGTDVRSHELVAMTLKRLGEPPRPVHLLPGRNSMYICQILASSKEGIAMAAPRLETMAPWGAIADVITQYAGERDIKPVLFAMDNDKEE